ncbi:MAG: hypothetical protein ABSF15_23015 [Candidatus Sulfotelmatobacter sp.]
MVSERAVLFSGLLASLTRQFTAPRMRDGLIEQSRDMISSFGFRQLHTHQFAMLLHSLQPMFDRPVLALIDNIRQPPGFLWSNLGLTVLKSGFDFIDQLLDRRPFGQIVVRGRYGDALALQDQAQHRPDPLFIIDNQDR